MHIQQLCRQAFALHNRGDITQSEELCLKILAKEAGNIQANYLLGTIRAQQNRTEEALALVGAALNSDPGDIHVLSLYGTLLQMAGRFAQALEVYDTVANAMPGQAELWNNRGGTLQSLNRLEDALESFDAALAIQPDHAGALYNRGTVLRQMGRPKEALVSLTRAATLAPNYAQAQNNRAAALQDLGRLEEALAGFDRALALIPDYAEALYNRGVVLHELGRPDEALTSLDRALALKPDYAEAWNKRAAVLQGKKRFEEAISGYRKALTLRADYLDAWKNLGSALCESNRIEDGFAAFARHAELVFGGLSDVTETLPVPPHKVRHDDEQRAYLIRELNAEGVDVTGKLYLADADRIAAPAVRRDSAVARQWRMGQPQIVVIDNSLTEQALDKVRRFCLGSTVWRKAYDAGYLGAIPEQGFASPLLAQIAGELRDAYPEIFAEHPLHYLWGFKYDSRLSGIALHADKAAVNVNFWITPDESNLDPESGGLVVWDVAAPADWQFKRYNGDTQACRDFLRRNNAKSITIPYRANRAVIFDSDLFHETDKILFKDGYLNRRINITLLYGRRTSDNR